MKILFLILTFFNIGFVFSETEDEIHESTSVDIIQDDYCENLSCEENLKKVIKELTYKYVSGDLTVIPGSLEVGAGIKAGKHIEADAFISQDLINLFGQRPYVLGAGARVRFLWNKSNNEKYFVEIEGTNYFGNQNEPGAFTEEYGAFIGNRSADGITDMSFGARHYKINEGSENNPSQEDLTIPTIRLRHFIK